MEGMALLTYVIPPLIKLLMSSNHQIRSDQIRMPIIWLARMTTDL